MKKQVTEHWVKLIAHINDSWMNHKMVDFNYPFRGRDFKNLKHFSRIFQPWGIMALWDQFLYSNNDYAKKTGYSIDAFVNCLPWLVDAYGWKARAKHYEDKLVGEYPSEIIDLLKFG